MRRFGSIFPFLEQGTANLRVGRLVANHDFVKALVQFASFDEFVFSSPADSNLREFQELIDSWGLPPERVRRVRLVNYVSLPQLLEELEFEVFHLGGWGYFMPGLHYLRNRHARNAWPITAITHSLHGRRVIDFAVRLVTAGMASYDSIFCTSRDGRIAMQNTLDGAAAIAGCSYQGKLDWLPLGIDDDLMKQHGNRHKAREQMGIPSDAVLVLVLGRITPVEKMDLAPLLDCFGRYILPGRQCPVYLVIAGGADPQNLRLLHKLVSDYRLDAFVRVRANFRKETKEDLLAASDIAVSLSDNTQETFGLSLLEAQAYGIPVIASSFDGYKDLVRDGTDGFLVESYWCEADPVAELFDVMDPDLSQFFQAQSVAIDMDQFVARLRLLIGDEVLRRRLGENGREKVRNEYLFSHIIHRYEDRWSELQHEARGCGLPAAATNSFQLSPTHRFLHYASRVLTPNDRVVAQPGRTLPPSYNEVNVLLQPDLLKSLLSRAQQPIPIEELLVGAQALGQQTWFAVMWLIKYNLLRLVE